ncbi:MAG TPA: hypothetical protein VGD11_03110 [Mycobacteriales bacterium]|jgi:hypothetical protein|nr:hypothetical protein [Mycobacterium sp.]
MSTFIGLAVTALVGTTLAVATTIGVVQMAQQTPSNTPSVTQPLIVYGQR